MLQQLEKSILGAIVYFDIFDYPLTLIEIYRFLLNLSDSSDRPDASLNDVRNSLEHAQILKEKVHFKNGFFYLKGRSRILNIRHERYIIAKQKFDNALEVLDILKRVPFVRAIFVCNSLACNNARKDSDIDLIVIAKRNGIWWARLFCLLLLSVMGVRPGYKNIKDKICLSVFVDENNLDFSGLRMGKRDIDFMYWVSNFYPVYDSFGLYRQFYAANKEWLQKNLVNIQQCAPHPERVVKAKPLARVVLEIILRPFSTLASAIQKAKFPSQIRDIMNQDTRVRVEPGLLKFHVNDRRIEHLEKFVKKYERVMK